MFEVGDIIIGKDDRNYSVTSSKGAIWKVVEINDDVSSNTRIEFMCYEGDINSQRGEGF